MHNVQIELNRSCKRDTELATKHNKIPTTQMFSELMGSPLKLSIHSTSVPLRSSVRVTLSDEVLLSLPSVREDTNMSSGPHVSGL